MDRRTKILKDWDAFAFVLDCQPIRLDTEHFFQKTSLDDLGGPESIRPATDELLATSATRWSLEDIPAEVAAGEIYHSNKNPFVD